ncbi:MAG: potassium channel protein [Desulfohalobiaceae bacterium]|nr:potassium channel protein [Desulfohalobiaceae bacterium]
MGCLFLLLLFLYGLYIYMALEGWSFLDSFYQVMITMSTVGFGEVHDMSDIAKVHTSILIFLGVGGFAYLLGSFTEAVMGGRIQMFWGRKKMEKKINSLSDHFIVCGYGRIGCVVARELIREKFETVVIENDAGLLEKMEEQHSLFVEGDATSDVILQQAGVTRAKAIITTLNTDAKNVYVTLASKQLNPDITVIARAESEDSVQKLEYAGANKVLTPYLFGGLRMAQMVLRPSVINFLEMAMHGENLALQMEELALTPQSSLPGKNLIESELRPKYNLIIIAIKKQDGGMIYNPKAEVELDVGDTLIVVGTKHDLEEVKKLL